MISTAFSAAIKKLEAKLVGENNCLVIVTPKMRAEVVERTRFEVPYLNYYHFNFVFLNASHRDVSSHGTKLALFLPKQNENENENENEKGTHIDTVK